MEMLYSLVAVFYLEGQSHSVVAQENLTKQVCAEKANFMVVMRTMKDVKPFYFVQVSHPSIGVSLDSPQALRLKNIVNAVRVINPLQTTALL